jgi:hypothetical protein
LLQKQIPAKTFLVLFGWGILAIVFFFVFDPYLWPHPISRLIQSITYHMKFQNALIVTTYYYPFWQPFYWLSNFSAFYNPGPASAFLVDVNSGIFCLVLIGLPSLLRKNPLFFVWLIIGVITLMVWTTKWPQYTMILIAPFSAAAAQGVYTLIWIIKKAFFKMHHADRKIS